MDSKLLLVKAITLLYRESLLDSKNDNSSDLVRTVLENVKAPELTIGANREREIVVGLKKTALEMCENPVDHLYERSDLLSTIKSNCQDDEALYETFVTGIELDMNDASLKRSIVNTRKTIQKHFSEQKVEELLSKGLYSLRHGRDKIKSFSTWLGELCASLEPFQLGQNGKDPAIVSEIDFSDVDSAAAVYEEIKHMQDGSSLMKTGWKELNRMIQGGFRRGEEVMIGALQHNYKTGFSLSLFKQVALYNKPMMIDPKKKPMLLRISFEDDLTNNFQFLFENIKAHEIQSDNPEDLITEKDVARYVTGKLQINGYHIRMLRVDPSQWTYMHICNKITELESEGYEIHLCMLDYLAMVPTTGCSVGPMGSDVRDMYRRIRNFMSPRKITMITPHQLSTEAKQLIRDGRRNFLQEVQGKGYLDKCRTLDQELDLELYIHIEKFQGQYFLNVQRGKHRGVPVIDDDFKSFYLPFPKKGPIVDDVNGPNSAFRRLGGGPIGYETESENLEAEAF